MNPTLIAALIYQVGIPELMRFLAQLHSEGRVLDEATALEKLNMDADAGNQLGEQFLDSHPQTGGL